MKKIFWTLLAAVLVILPLAVVGCKSKVENVTEAPGAEMSEAMLTTETAPEPAQTVASEAIPPTAAPEMVSKPAPEGAAISADRNKEIQIALKNAGFYAGAIDGKIGPKTKEAIREFQKAKGLKADGKVGPKTWAELQKHLTTQ